MDRVRVFRALSSSLVFVFAFLSYIRVLWTLRLTLPTKHTLTLALHTFIFAPRGWPC